MVQWDPVIHPETLKTDRILMGRSEDREAFIYSQAKAWLPKIVFPKLKIIKGINWRQRHNHRPRVRYACLCDLFKIKTG